MVDEEVWAVSGAMGLRFGFGGAPLEGFYVGPKLGVLMRGATQLATFPATGPLPLGAAVMRAFLGGVEAGWQWRAGGIRLAFGIGVSGGHYEQDMKVAEAALKALG